MKRNIVAKSCVVLFILTGLVCAQTDYTWINSSGGDYGISTNWDPEGVPDSPDTAIFDLGNTYTVNFDDAYTASKMRIDAGEVAFDLNGFSYLLDYDSNENDPAAIVNGLLEITNGEIHSGAVTIAHNTGDSGTVNITTGGFWKTFLVSTPSWYPLVIGREGHGYLNVSSGGIMRHGHGWAAMGFESNADITVDGMDSQWYVDGWFGMGTNGRVNVTASNQGYIRIGRCDMGMFATSRANVTIQSASSWDLFSQPEEVALMLGYYGSASVTINEQSMVYCSDHLNVAAFPGSRGQLTLSDQDTHLNIGRDFIVGGHSQIPTGGDPIPPGPGGKAEVDINNGAQISVGGNIKIYPEGSISLDNSMLSGNVDVQGTLSGSGTIFGTVNNEGSITAGNPLGVIVITGDYTQTSDAFYRVQIAWTGSPAIGCIFLQGSASINGMLQVSLINGFTPSPTDTFVIFTADMGLSGNFLNGASTYTGPQGTFDVTYGPNSIILSNYRSTPACTEKPRADLNDDCIVNLLDLALLAEEWLADGLNP